MNECFMAFLLQSHRLAALFNATFNIILHIRMFLTNV